MQQPAFQPPRQRTGGVARCAPPSTRGPVQPTPAPSSSLFFATPLTAQRQQPHTAQQPQTQPQGNLNLAQQQQPLSNAVTLTTQCSMDRWPRFLQLARSWGGPVSVAVRIPAPQHTPTSTACLQELQELVAAFTAAQPGQGLAVSVLHAGVAPVGGDKQSSSSTTAYEQLYPINALRNLALQHAATPLVFPVDADFQCANGLHALLHAPSPYPSLAEAAGSSEEPPTSLVQQLLAAAPDSEPQQRPVMLVLPAFQLCQPPVPDSEAVAAPRAKAELAAGLASGAVQPFDCGVFAPKQQPIQVDAWLSATQPFAIEYTDLFEVHGGIAVRQQLPQYSEAFRGHGLNKQQHAWHAARLGYRFVVLPDAFIVTAPHPRPTTWRPQPGTAADAAHLAHIQRVFERFKQELEEQLARRA